VRCLEIGSSGRIRTYPIGAQPEVLTECRLHIRAQNFRGGFEICEVIAAWPDLPEALRAGVLAIVRSGGLSINRGSESANGAKVAAVGAAQRQSSVAGAKPEQPVCGQVGAGGSSR
jgi:hypothetical protein